MRAVHDDTSLRPRVPCLCNILRLDPTQVELKILGIQFFTLFPHTQRRRRRAPTDHAKQLAFFSFLSLLS